MKIVFLKCIYKGIFLFILSIPIPRVLIRKRYDLVFDLSKFRQWASGVQCILLIRHTDTSNSGILKWVPGQEKEEGGQGKLPS